MQGEILFIPSARETGVRKDVCMTQAFTVLREPPVGYLGILHLPHPKGRVLCCGAAPGLVCLSSSQAEPGWCLTTLLLCIGQNSAQLNCHITLL